MPDPPFQVCVVTVTYSDRWKFLEQVIARVLAFNTVVQLIIVNNASTYRIDNEITDDRITVLSNIENLGSAQGYQQGIKHAYHHISCDFIWLLDDDNLPEEGSLADLLAHWNAIPGGNDAKALFCLRCDRLPHIKIAMGELPERYYLVPDNFLGFHLFRILKNKFNKLRDKLKQPKPYADHVQLPYVPYGGLLLHKEMIARIGYPDEQFYLYVDDSEYTYRITQQNGTIWLIPSSRITDVDQSQGIGYKQKPFRSHLLDQWSFRTYYHVRNRLYFYSRVAKKNPVLFTINKVLYLAFLKLLSVMSNKQSAYKKLLAAVDDGLNGRLGKASPDKF